MASRSSQFVHQTGTDAAEGTLGGAVRYSESSGFGKRGDHEGLFFVE